MTFAAMNLSSNLQLGSSSWKLNNRTVNPHVIIRRVIVRMRRGGTGQSEGHLCLHQLLLVSLRNVSGSF